MKEIAPREDVYQRCKRDMTVLISKSDEQKVMSTILVYWKILHNYRLVEFDFTHAIRELSQTLKVLMGC